MQKTSNQQLPSTSGTKHDRLVISPHPYNDESFLGYLFRLTKANLYDNITWILRLARLQTNPLGKLALLSTNCPKDLRGFEELTGVNKEILASLFYTPLNLQGQVDDYLIFGHPVPRYTLRLQRPKVCPLCLSEKPYARRMWDLAPITVCPIHKVLLYDKCPTCSRKISWHRKSLFECRCGRDWRRDSPSIVSEDELEVARTIYALCEIPLQGTTHFRPEPIAALRLDEYLTSLFFIAGQFIGIMDTRGKRLATSLTNPEIHSVLHKASQVFQDWPNNFYAFLDWKRESTPDIRHERGLRRDFGQYKSALYVQLSADCYNFLRQAFEEYIATHWQGGYPTALRRLDHKARKNKCYLTVVETKRILKIAVPGIMKLLATNVLTRACETKSIKGVLLIESDGVWHLKEKLKNCLTLNEAKNHLGLNGTFILELVESRLLHPLRGPRIDGCKKWQFPEDDLRLFRRRVNDLIDSSYGCSQNGPIRFGLALDAIQRAGGTCGTLFQAVFDRKISVVNGKQELGLSNLQFCGEDVHIFAHKEVARIHGEFYSVPEAAKLIGTNREVVYCLLRSGMIRASELPHVQARRFGSRVRTWINIEKTILS